MAHVLVLGAGLVAGPLLRHLLDATDHTVTVAALDDVRARALVGDHPRGRVIALDVSAPQAVDALVATASVVVSMLPYAHHPAVAERCIAHRRHLVTTSYISPAMRALHARAVDAGVVLLNEMGLDPGIDHMSAMRVIHDVRARGGRVTAFRSYCGGLPAPEANTNPFGYKFSWSPRGVVLAARNNARYLHNGQEITVPGEQLFARPEHVEFDGLGQFEGYPNRNSLEYIALYGLEGVRTMFRGTLRNMGHCAVWKAMGDLGLYSDEPRAVPGGTYAALLASLVGVSAEGPLHTAVEARLEAATAPRVMEALDWLGLFAGSSLPAEPVSPLDALVAAMVQRMAYGPGERDMVLLRHEFVAEFPHHREAIRSTLVDYGIPEGDSAMARTVGLPAALGVTGILDGLIRTPGVQAPVAPEVYVPVLAALEQQGVTFHEDRATL